MWIIIGWVIVVGYILAGVFNYRWLAKRQCWTDTWDFWLYLLIWPVHVFLGLTAEKDALYPPRRLSLTDINETPLVSIIMPAYGETWLNVMMACESLRKQTYENWELLIYWDESQELLSKWEPRLRCIPNPRRWPNFAYIEGPKIAKGRYIMLASSHSTYAPDYIELCVKTIRETCADCVGGVITAKPSADTSEAQAIATVLNSSLGSMGSKFRTGVSEIVEADTVGYGFYARHVFLMAQFSPKLLRSSDMRFNRELKRLGCKIYLNPAIKAIYYPSATLPAFRKHSFSDGYWITKPLWFKQPVGNLRHYLPLLALLVWPLTFPAWLLVMVVKHPNLDTLQAYFCRHWIYAAGSLWGLIGNHIK